MRRNTPTIQQLLAFEALARHLALPATADELCVTASAVSRSIAELESFLDLPLFDRAGRRFRLSAHGQDYLARIAPSLRALESASLEMRARRSGDGMLVLASVPTFTTKWLVPRLPALRRLHPGITLNFHRHLEGRDAHPPEIDAAIRYGLGDWPGVTSEYIAGREFAIVCAPGHLRGGRRTRQRLTEATLLQHQAVPDAWSACARQLELKELRPPAGPRFDQYSALISAACAGMGVGLVPHCLVTEELATHRLERLIEEPVLLDQGHFLCYRQDRLGYPVLGQFRDWLICHAVAD
jgi:LysR family transcriptional regulator, glycine cleavage system transcriptional activator